MIRVVSTDQGGEFQSSFDNMLGRHEIDHWQTAAECPATRGAIERVWGTVMPMMACNLRYAGLREQNLDLWWYALSYAVWCYNRVTHANDTVTPFEHRFQEEPDLKHAKVWGCPCFVRIPIDKQLKTPDKAKSQEGIFLGFHEIDGRSADGAMVLSRTGEVISGAVTVFDEHWKLKRAPASEQPEAPPAPKAAHSPLH